MPVYESQLFRRLIAEHSLLAEEEKGRGKQESNGEADREQAEGGERLCGQPREAPFASCGDAEQDIQR